MRYVKSTDGTQIAVYDYNPQGRDTVFFVHGWPLSHKIYEYQIERLLDRGCRVVAVDLRGFGQSDTPAEGYSYDQMARDLYAVVKALGLRRFTLTGFSMGGAVSLRYMRLFEGYGVKKLILLAAAAPCWTERRGYSGGHSREYVNQLIYMASTDRPQLCRDFAQEQLFASPQSQAAKDWFEDIALSASGVGTVQGAICLRDEDGREDLCTVSVPTIIIHGAKDTVVGSDLIRLQHKGIKDSMVYTLDNSGHGIMYDELEKFNEIFLEAVTG